jgi:hypothetical protein
MYRHLFDTPHTVAAALATAVAEQLAERLAPGGSVTAAISV